MAIVAATAPGRSHDRQDGRHGAWQIATRQNGSYEAWEDRHKMAATMHGKMAIMMPGKMATNRQGPWQGRHDRHAIWTLLTKRRATSSQTKVVVM